MKTKPILLLCALSLSMALPDLAAARSPAWGQLPGGQPRGHQIQASRTCDLTGLWKDYLSDPRKYPNSWIKMRFTKKRRQRANLIVYEFHREGVPGGRRGVALLDPDRRRVEFFSLLHVQFPYDIGFDTGSISPDCRHLSLTSYGSGDLTSDKKTMVLMGR